VSELGSNLKFGTPEGQEPNGLLIDAKDHRALAETRQRTVARLQLVWNKRVFLLRVALLGMALSGVVASLIPKRYMGTARLMPPDATSGNASMLAALAGHTELAGLAQSALSLKTTADLFVGILESNTVRDGLIQKFGLQTVYRDRYLEDAREDLAGYSGISEDLKSGIITVSVVDRDPLRAAAMAEEYVNELNWVVSNLSTSSAHRERTFVEQRLAQVNQELETAERNFSEFSSKNGAIDITEQGKAMVTAAAMQQGQLIATESELEGLRQIYTDDNVRVRAAKARIAELKHQLEELGGTGAAPTSGIQALYPPIRKLPVLGVTYADLYRRVKVEEAVFEALTQEYELAKVEEVKEIPTVKVLDAPSVPQKKSFPPRLLVTMLGTTLALIGGTAWVLGHSAWQNIDASDPRKTLAVAVWSDLRSVMPLVSVNGSRRSTSTKQHGQ
jgi:capsule polysaccharide export protein KpsE/RkpR